MKKGLRTEKKKREKKTRRNGPTRKTKLERTLIVDIILRNVYGKGCRDFTTSREVRLPLWSRDLTPTGREGVERGGVESRGDGHPTKCSRKTTVVRVSHLYPSAPG